MPQIYGNEIKVLYRRCQRQRRCTRLVGDLALALGTNLESLGVNPLSVDGALVEALGAAVTWRPEEKI